MCRLKVFRDHIGHEYRESRQCKGHADSIDRIHLLVYIKPGVANHILERNSVHRAQNLCDKRGNRERNRPLHHPFTIYLLHVFPHRGLEFPRMFLQTV